MQIQLSFSLGACLLLLLLSQGGTRAQLTTAPAPEAELLMVPAGAPAAASSRSAAAGTPLQSPISDPSAATPPTVKRADGETYAASYLEPNFSRFTGETIQSIENCDPDCCRRRCLANEDCLSFTVDDTGLCDLVSGLAPCAIYAANYTSGLIFDTANDNYSAPARGLSVLASVAATATSWTCRNYRGRVEGGSACLADCVQANCTACLYTQSVLGGQRFDCTCLNPEPGRLRTVRDPNGVYLWVHGNAQVLSPRASGAGAGTAAAPESEMMAPEAPMVMEAPTPSPSSTVAGGAAAGGTTTATTPAPEIATAPLLEPGAGTTGKR